jgi:hypothetical protein
MVARSAFALVAVLFAFSHCAIDDRDLEEHGADDDNGGSSNSGTGGTSSGTGGTSSGTGGTSDLPVDCRRDADDDDCYACQKASCCTEYLACTNSDECLYFVSCGLPCADTSCLAACAADYPEGAQLFDDFSSCGDASCVDTCSS